MAEGEHESSERASGSIGRADGRNGPWRASKVAMLLVNDGSRAIRFEDYYIYIIYTPNLGLEIAVSVREREQGRFRGSIEGARGSIEGARFSVKDETDEPKSFVRK